MAKERPTGEQRLDEVAEAAMARYRVPGLAVGLWHGGREYVAGYGVTNVEHPLPVDADTLFQIGSITKTFVATAMMRLVEQGLVELDAPVRRYLPSFRLADAEAAARITVRQLFQHVAGFAGDHFADFGRGDDALARYVESLDQLASLVPLGSQWSYNNAAFSVAGRIMEIVTEQPFETVMREQLLDPLGMTRTFFFTDEIVTHRVAAGHNVLDAEGAVVARPWGLSRANNPAGAIASTVRDMLRYARFHLGDGLGPGGDRLLTPGSMRLMHSPQVRAALPGESTGLAWNLVTLGGVALSRHGGGTTGQRAMLMLARERDFALCVLTNASRGDEASRAITEHVLRSELGITAEPPVHQAVPLDRLVEYAGTYRAMLNDAEVRVERGGLVLQERRKGWVAEVDRPMPQPPSVRLAFVAPEIVMALDEPFTGNRGEFVREAGGVAWLRWGGRLMRRNPQQPA